jgi:hypothetical protein
MGQMWHNLIRIKWGERACKKRSMTRKNANRVTARRYMLKDTLMKVAGIFRLRDPN